MDLEKQIHDALRAKAAVGIFHPIRFSKETGEMEVQDTVDVLPSKITIQPLTCEWRKAENYGRALADERGSWRWLVRLSFTQRVSVAAFEQQCASCITIPPSADGTVGGAVVRLVSSEYVLPPEQSPNRGSLVDLSFEASIRR